MVESKFRELFRVATFCQLLLFRRNSGCILVSEATIAQPIATKTQKNMSNQFENLWSDDISLADFTRWIETEYETKKKDGPTTLGVMNVLAIRMQVRKLLTGQGVGLWRPDICFYPHAKVTLSNDLDKMQEEAEAFEQAHNIDGVNPFFLEYPIKMLRLYKDARYPAILQERKERFLVFRETTMRHESASAVLGRVEVEGVLENIYSFVFHTENKNGRVACLGIFR